MQVSPLCLGAMMFGGWGEPDHDTSVGIIHPALDAGHQLHRHRRRLLAGRVGDDRRQGARRRPARRRRPGDEVPWPDGRPGRRADGHRRATRTSAATRRRWIVQRGREQPAPAADRLDRPLPGAPARPGHRHRGDARRADRPAARKARSAPSGRSTFPAHEVVEAQWVARAARPRPVRHRAAAVLAAGPRHRGRPAAGGRAVRHGRAAVEPAGRRLAQRGATARARNAPTSQRAERMPARYDLSDPANQRKLDAADALGACWPRRPGCR